MQYLILQQDEVDETIATAILSREREHAHYELNRLSFERQLEDKNLTPEQRADLQKRLGEVALQTGVVVRAHESLVAQLPTARRTAAIAAALAKEAGRN
ncbi:MAG: hypothetical protein K8T91_00240 [Planctomycetes bacterium]|nr:hypothetical protein [Planctomycetota bacterium]